ERSIGERREIAHVSLEAADRHAGPSGQGTDGGHLTSREVDQRGLGTQLRKRHGVEPASAGQNEHARARQPTAAQGPPPVEHLAYRAVGTRQRLLRSGEAPASPCEALPGTSVVSDRVHGGIVQVWGPDALMDRRGAASEPGGELSGEGLQVLQLV